MSPDKPIIRNVIVVRGGHMQRQGDFSGTVSLHAELHKLFAGPDTLVLWYPWHAPSGEVAEFVWRVTPDIGYSIVEVGYSWGGCAAVNDCRELKARGRKVAGLVVSDAVFRPCGFAWAPKVVQYAISSVALTPDPIIVVPSNVGSVVSFVQENSLLVRDGRSATGWMLNPRGHRLVREFPPKGSLWCDHIDTTIASKVCDRVHAYMDDLPEFHEAAEKACRGVGL